ncbi:MAG: electron transport complex subunit RsxC [Candidatus Omnitrophica bacterium]|nr:electron transport complex subunit RsxC [Candidatus Omnitrophota bacterium]
MSVYKNLKTFPVGGIHPEDHKLSAAKAIEFLKIPDIISIPVSQHLGAPAKPIVQINDRVKVGQVIAESGGYVSTNIHASASGIVSKIDNVMDASGYKRLAITIKVEGDDWFEGIELSPDIKKEIILSKEEIIAKLQKDGIVGLGGATFPIHVKLTPPKGKIADILLINGVECEPFLTSDHRLMIEKGEEILIGTQIIMQALGVSESLVGIESNKPDAIEHLSKLAKNYNGICIVPLKVQYPQGAEKQLIEALTSRQVPIGGLPIDVGVVVQNVGTAFAVYESIQKNKPLVERVVTVTGKNVQNPSNFLVRFGVPISNLIEAAGGLPNETGKIISGGPMMGKALNTPDVPVTKGTSGILLISEAESKRGEVLNCIRCAKCVGHCPLGLEPYLLMSLVEKGFYDQAQQEQILNCCECGSCAFTCPADRPLLDYIRLGKSIINQRLREKSPK